MAEHYIIDGKEHVYESAAEKHLTDKTITENGTYSAEDEPGDINGYKNVTVDVEGGGGTVTKTVYTTVTGGYNGGAVIAITIDEEVVFTATAIDTYNKNYNITHDVIYISGSPVIIDITPPETTTSALGISIEGINTIQYSVMPDGANTSYGYNFSDSDPLTVGGGSSTLVEKTITENGTYDPSDDNADGYSQVTVDVPNEYVDSPVNDYAFDYDPNNTATTVKSGGFLFTCKRACKVTKIRVYGVSTEAKVFISNVNGTTLSSGTSNQMIENQWNDVELDSPIDLFEDTEYVVWCSQNGVLLKYKNFFGSLYSDYISYKKGMYSQLADTFPSNAENGNAYAVDLYIDSIKVIKTAELITKQITQNGTYNASDDNADGYSRVNVNVPYRPLIGTTIPSNSQGSNGDIYIYGNEVVPTGLGWAANEAYLVEDANELLATASGRPYYKINDGMAIGVFLKALDYAGPVLISSNPEYAYYTYNSSGTNYNKTIDGITMYMSTFNDWYGSYSVPTDGVLKDCILEVNYNASRSADYEGIFDAILEATAFTVGNGGIVCRDIYYKDNGIWKTSGFAAENSDTPPRIPMLTSEQWEALSTEQKKQYGLLAVEKQDSGFSRGDLLNGADYIPLEVEVISTGGARPGTNLGYTFEEDGDYKVLVVTFNCMASYNAGLNNELTLNGSEVTPNEEFYNTYNSSSDNVRNYRVSYYELDNISANDSFAVNASNVSSYTEIMYIVLKTNVDLSNMSVARSMADSALGYSGTHAGITVLGSCVGNNNGEYSISAETINGTGTYTVPNLSTAYCSTFLFIFEDA